MLRRFKVTALIVSVILILNILISTAFAEGTTLDDKLNYLKQIMEFIEYNYPDNVTDDQLINGAIKGMMEVLDPHSTYFTKEELEAFLNTTSGTYSGVGMVVEKRGNYITVVAPIEGSPAFRAGIKPGDKIIKVNDTDVTDWDVDKVASLLRGEVGTKVKVGIIREGSKDILNFELVREVIKISSVSYKILEGNLGYIRISEFNESTDEDLTKALAYFDQNNVSKLIIDLRNNPGGLLQEVVDVAKHFIPEGPIVTIEYKNMPSDVYTSDLKNPKYKLVVLVNGGSASASEIFAGAVQDSKVGLLVGTKTFGKGTVQTLVPLNDGGAIKLTIAKYKTRNGRYIDGVGINPDIWVDEQAFTPITISNPLKLWSKGKEVLEVQKALSVLGYKIKADGIYGRITSNAVKDFQSKHGLNKTGILDFDTLSALNQELSKISDIQLQKAVEVLKAM